MATYRRKSGKAKPKGSKSDPALTDLPRAIHGAMPWSPESLKPLSLEHTAEAKNQRSEGLAELKTTTRFHRFTRDDSKQARPLTRPVASISASVVFAVHADAVGLTDALNAPRRVLPRS